LISRKYDVRVRTAFKCSGYGPVAGSWENGGVLLKELTVAYLVKNFLSFYGV
jgi:hypothetical protein